jgi:hypothetical protein
VEYLRERLSPMDLWVEPEGHMAADKRADMVVLGQNALKLPVEVKRDGHPELWVAAKNQLERLYTRDPQARGYGLYLVFYFGTGRGCSITPHPEGALLTDSLEDLERALSASVPAEHRDRITCTVIDVSPPALPRSKTSKPKSKKVGGKALQISNTARKRTDTKAPKPKGETKKRTRVREASSQNGTTRSSNAPRKGSGPKASKPKGETKKRTGVRKAPRRKRR